MIYEIMKKKDIIYYSNKFEEYKPHKLKWKLYCLMRKLKRKEPRTKINTFKMIMYTQNNRFKKEEIIE